MNKFSQNDILFYNPGECINSNSGSGSICGNTAKEIYWSALSKYVDDPIKIAGIVGNLTNEGGMNPAAWEGGPNLCESGGINSSGELLYGWDYYYGGTSSCTGVGAFGLTSELSKYLHYINDNSPELIKYLKDTKEYSYNFLYHPGCEVDSNHPSYGDCLLEKIGAAEFGKLVEFEIGYALGDNFNPTKTQEYLGKSFSTPADAAVWWMDEWERPYSRNPTERGQDAEEAYDQLKDHTCTSDSSSTVSGKDIIWIGDSNSVTAGEDLLEKTFPGLKNGGWGPSFNDANSYIQGGKQIDEGGSSNPSGIEILEKIIKEKKLRKYLVFALGDNGGWEKEYIDKIMKLVGNDTKVIFTTNELYCSYHKDYYGSDCKYKINYTTGNEELRKAPERYKNVYIADVAAKYKDEYFDPANTTIEFNSKGAQMFVDTIKSALLSASSGSSSSSNSSTTDSSTTKAEWKDGWLVEGSIEGAIKQDVNKKTDLSEPVNPVGSYTTSDGKPDKILLHNTQELGEGYDVYPAGNKYPAHFTIDLRNKKVWQHFSIYQPSLAVATYDKSGPIQIEIIGFTKRATKKDDGTFEYEEPANYKSEWDLQNFSDEDWDYLAKLLIAISEETGIPLTSSVEWTPGMKNGLNKEEFLKYKGVLGHMHTPDNGSEDPGDIWQYLEKAISRQNSCNSYTGDYPEYRQYDPRWGSLQYGTTAADTFQNSACGPTSMAVIATIASGQEILPTDVANLLGDQYYYEVGMSTLDPIVCEEYGCEAKKIDTSASEIKQYLQDGWMIHVSGGCDGPHSSTCPYSDGGHYVALLELKDNDTVVIEDPGWGDSAIQEYKLSDVVNGMGAAEAIRGNGSGFCKKDSANYCGNDNSVGTGTEASKPIGPVHEDSTNIPCDPRTKDLGIRDDAYYNYEKYSIRLCSIPNIKMNGTQGDDGDDGFVHVNSRVSGAFYSLSEEHKKRCGNYLEAVDDYRTNAEQTALYNAYLNGTGNLAAVPGSPYANHQGGLAIDFSTSTYCGSDSSVASGPGGWFEPDFLAQFGLQDGRRFSSPENWHVDVGD